MLDFNTTDYNSLKTSQLKRMADYWQRQYLLKHSKKGPYGKIYCPLKKLYYHKSKMQASHFIDRACMNTRYHPDNVHLISEDSNIWDAKVLVDGYKSKHHKDYEEYLKEKIGEKKFQELLDMSKELRIFAREDYIDVIKKFRYE